ncbi:endonuclease [Hyalangium minutum]|uniref:Serine protease, subtilase family protein n=1 Tax=Hyalangium minutum TaxID=394096 RepID=A0A085WN86_9BACT|nr:endonuclease [Hyalangium minutum]KFE69149.1 Serine protease, subtilase family protein [Hyalangium minutum]
MNSVSLQRSLSQPRPVAAPLAREALRSTPAAVTPRASERSSFTSSPSRADSLTKLGSLFAPTAAKPASAAAETEKTVRASATPNLAIPDNSKVESTLRFDDALSLKSGKVSVDIPHSYRGDLVVTLTSPSGKSQTLSNKQGGSEDNLKATFDLSAFAGESTKGDWKLTVEDTAKQDVGTLKEWNLELTGTAKSDEPQQPPTGEDPFQGLRDQALLKAIQGASSGKHVVSYSEARKEIFTNVDVNNGKVRDVYTHREINGGKIPNSSDMNVEHTWPQSKGATGTAKSDLHHLFPTDSKANSTRSSFPFGKVEKVQWSSPSGAKFGTDAQGRKVFEPPDDHKGNVARAMFYFSAEYNKRIPPEEESVLREWNKSDAVDAAEIERNRRVAGVQGNNNQFVLHSELADRISDF